MKWHCPTCGLGPFRVEPHELPVHHDCVSREERALAMIPEEKRKLLGDRVKDMFAAIGIPACDACKERAAWLNSVNKYLFG